MARGRKPVRRWSCASRPSWQSPVWATRSRQILAALGVGQGQGGRDGYGLFNEDVAVYGPNVQLAGEQAGGRGETRADAARHDQQVAGDARDAGLAQPEGPGRVRLLPDAKFPLRYRDLVGEYFRAVAESQKEGK